MSKILAQKAPLTDATVELRFASELPGQVIVGLLYNKLQSMGYNDFKELPIAQLPVQVLEQDKALKYVAHYRLASSRYLVGVSQQMISVSLDCSGDKYPGWSNYQKEIAKVVHELITAARIEQFSRIGVRYINLIQKDDPLRLVNLSIKTQVKDLTQEQNIGFICASDDVRARITFNTKAVLTKINKEQLSGALLDIDAFTDSSTECNQFIERVKRCHDYAEEKFLNITTKKYQETLE